MHTSVHTYTRDDYDRCRPGFDLMEFPRWKVTIGRGWLISRTTMYENCWRQLGSATAAMRRAVTWLRYLAASCIDFVLTSTWAAGRSTEWTLLLQYNFPCCVALEMFSPAPTFLSFNLHCYRCTAGAFPVPCLWEGNSEILVPSFPAEVYSVTWRWCQCHVAAGGEEGDSSEGHMMPVSSHALTAVICLHFLLIALLSTSDCWAKMGGGGGYKATFTVCVVVVSWSICYCLA